MYEYKLNYNNCPHYFGKQLELSIFFNGENIVNINVNNYKKRLQQLLSENKQFITDDYNMQFNIDDDYLIIAHIPEGKTNISTQEECVVKSYIFNKVERKRLLQILENDVDE